MPDLSRFADLVSPGHAYIAVRVALTLLAGLLLARVLAGGMRRLLVRSGNAPFAPLGRRATYWVVLGMAIASALEQIGVDLTVLIGAAGVLTVAVGFASQTSASNLISGLFLTFERSVAVGDILQIGATMGEVLSVDLLSIKLRTFDNVLVRVPNESLVKSEFRNLSAFPIRRADLRVSVAYGSDLAQVREVLMAAAEAHTAVFQEPAPVLMVLGYLDSGIDLQFNVWTERAAFVSTKTEMYEAIHTAFAAQGIEIPFPHRVMVDRQAGGGTLQQ